MNPSPPPSPRLSRRVRACACSRRRAHGVLCVSPVVVSPVSFFLASFGVILGGRAELFSLPRASMASSSVGHGATGAPPPPDRHAAFYKLVDKKVIAGVLCRHARAVELAAEAATLAEALFTDDSLVVAKLRVDGSLNLSSLALHASGAEREAFARQSWALLLSTIPILVRRLESNTQLPGTIRERELDYAVHQQAAIFKAKSDPVLPPTVLRACASVLVYDTLLDAIYRGLDLCPFPWWMAAQKRSVELFVLQGLDVIPRTAGAAFTIAGEEEFAAMMERYMNLRNYYSAFCAFVFRKWRSEAVTSVLRARGVLHTGIAAAEQSSAEFEARKRTDIAKHGLRDCALPFCSKTEKTVKEFAGCSGCRTVVYCCLEHQALDWKAHKKACHEAEAARLAKEEDEKDTGGGAGAA